MPEEYRSIHQGATIDEAVGRAKPGAELDQRINEMRMNFIRRLETETEIAAQAVRDAAQNALQYLNGTFTITENPDYLQAVTDSDGRLLLGIRKDGKAYFGAGIPPQIEEELYRLSGWENRVSVLENNFRSHDRAIDRLTTGLSDLVNAAFTSLQQDADGLWYAYNMRGIAAGGPYSFGGNGENSAGNTTLAEFFGAVTDDSIAYSDPTPISASVSSSSVTLAEFFGAVEDDSMTYLEPTPVVMVS